MVTQVKNLGNTIAFPEEKASRARARHSHLEKDHSTTLHLHMLELLQSTLELPEVLMHFFEMTKRELHLNSLNYRHDKLSTDIVMGKSSTHSCHYSLISPDENLGELTFTRNKRFMDKELERLETMINWLIKPLRNALKYREAVQHALHDPLTGAGNRIALESALDKEISLAKRHNHPLALLVVDIDHFKKVNDTYGHHAGDCVLKDVVRILRHSCRKTDDIFRFGGEEFVVILNQTDRDGAEIIAERLRISIQDMTTTCHDQRINVTASIGLTSLTSADTVNTLFERADRAMYLAKQHRNTTVYLAQEHSTAPIISL